MFQCFTGRGVSAVNSFNFLKLIPLSTRGKLLEITHKHLILQKTKITLSFPVLLTHWSALWELTFQNHRANEYFYHSACRSAAVGEWGWREQGRSVWQKTASSQFSHLPLRPPEGLRVAGLSLRSAKHEPDEAAASFSATPNLLGVSECCRSLLLLFLNIFVSLHFLGEDRRRSRNNTIMWERSACWQLQPHFQTNKGREG